MKIDKKHKKVAVAAVLLIAVVFVGNMVAWNNAIRSTPDDLDRIYPAEEGKTMALELAGGTESYERKIIYNANIVLEVDNVETAFYGVKAIAKEFDGFVSDSSITERYGSTQGYVVLRIPEEDFNAAVERAKMFGTLKSESMSADDVTEQHADLTARLNSLKATEERLLELIGQAESVTEIIEIEKELADIRERIESLEARLNYLDSMVEMSTIRVNLREPEGITSEFNWIEVLGDTADGFINSTKGLIVVAGTLLPFAIAGAAGWMVYKKTRKKRHGK